ncbi:MAG: tRNA (N(6)-L-threonylcarbamoyladenosine(37)-C(2))-methylthiotransferase [Nanoarchaeota archaeon]
MAVIYIKTYGCSHNIADSETIAHFLKREGHDIKGLDADIRSRQDKRTEIRRMNECDITIINTCTVKNPSESKFFSTLKQIDIPVIVAGCIAQSQAGDPWLEDYSAIGVDQLHTIGEVVKQTLKGIVTHRLKREQHLFDRSFIPMMKKNDHIAIIPILQGCLGSCSYCKTKSARGHLKSHPLQSIIAQVRQAKRERMREAWLVSEDNGAYGLDIGSTLPQLLEEIATINGDFKVRIGMINPQYAVKYLDELCELLKKEIFYKFLHIPLQSGSDKVLANMNREYSVQDFEMVIQTLRTHIPDITISTDIIAGYPTETEEDFKQTINLLNRMKIPILNISKFYPRKGTPASKLKQHPTKIVKRRSSLITELFNSYKTLEHIIGNTVKAHIIKFDERNGKYIGKTDNYTQILVSSENDILGETVYVKVKETTRDDLRATIVTEQD